ncbi:hypothetical protein LTR56_026147 [Elasticomyces elasticus]|nr:hypothetical protein LTR56_026147 [Elasticomyces elasticus]KAK3665430.1 hypothetical protein LTR22_003660 [Elasticomyces elasticus]KAK4929926.1 hypothetical protein LTR49_003553 [Elasticomyces elasticus]KAK5769264.1 hypothetical protein LTS12_000615 [Elasticomyces elasticus]
MAPVEQSWQSKAARAQQSVIDSIPLKWRLPPGTAATREKNARQVILSSNLLTKKQIEITELTATELLERIHHGDLSCVEAMEAFLIRTAIAHQLVNCLVEFMPEEALAQAELLDAEYKKSGKIVGPLHGLPMSVKDILDVEGKIVTFAAVAWVDCAPSKTDASVVKVMRDAGAIFLARTNLWGRTLNAHNPAFGSGGSSGGEAVLTALRGTPASPLSTDIGGSIRAPAAFNGLYAMRPTSERCPHLGGKTAAPGNVSVKVSAGPACWSMTDLKLFVHQILTHPTIPHEPTCCMPYWNEQPAPSGRLRVGVMVTDGVVDPHPPIQRAIHETTAKLKAAGHDVFEFKPPFDLWEAALTTWALYFQTGAREVLELLASADEPPIKQFELNLKIFKTKELTVAELFKRNVEQGAYKIAFQQAWDAVAGGMDCIVCPCAPMAGVPHDAPLWWGYTTLMNLLDYPSIILPVKDLVISPEQDPKDLSYQPRDNPFDKANHELYDPEVWQGHPVTLQLVGRPYRDEGLISVCEVIDSVVNAPADVV